MRFLAILCLLIFTLTACQKRYDKALRQKQAAKFLTQKSGEDTLHYQLDQIFDPYMDKPRKMGKGQSLKNLALHTQGTFAEYDSLNHYSGLWFINKTKERLRLVYQVQNGDTVPEARQDTSFRYQLVKLSNDSLVIGKQGRHGIVQYIYLLQIDSTSFDSSFVSTPLDSLAKSDSALTKVDSTKKKSVPTNPMAAGQASLAQTEANELIFDSLPIDTSAWRLYSRYDPYQDMLPQEERSDSTSGIATNPTYLCFTRNGSFIKFDQNYYNEGAWYLSADSPGRMRLAYTIQNGVAVSEINQDKYFRFQFRKLAKDTLQIAQQGRHGMVRSTYLYCPKDSIPPYPKN
ncbi:MAG: hypothetical protein AAF927_15445 [Bacteroidota bacterium]